MVTALSSSPNCGHGIAGLSLCIAPSCVAWRAKTAGFQGAQCRHVFFWERGAFHWDTHPAMIANARYCGWAAFSKSGARVSTEAAHQARATLGRSTGPELTLGKSPLLFCERVNLSLKSKDQKVKPRPLCTRSPWFQDGDLRWNRSQSSGCVELWTIKLLWAPHEISSR